MGAVILTSWHQLNPLMWMKWQNLKRGKESGEADLWQDFKATILC